jgi:hypothetical protein
MNIDPLSVIKFLGTKNIDMIQVDIDGHPPFLTGSKWFSSNFGNLLFLAIFYFRSRFEALNDIFWASKLWRL